MINVYIECLAQDCSNSSALAMELLQFCAKPSIWYIQRDVHIYIHKLFFFLKLPAVYFLFPYKSVGLDYVWQKNKIFEVFCIRPPISSTQFPVVTMDALCQPIRWAVCSAGEGCPGATASFILEEYAGFITFWRRMWVDDVLGTILLMSVVILKFHFWSDPNPIIMIITNYYTCHDRATQQKWARILWPKIE